MLIYTLIFLYTYIHPPYAHPSIHTCMQNIHIVLLSSYPEEPFGGVQEEFPDGLAEGEVGDEAGPCHGRLQRGTRDGVVYYQRKGGTRRSSRSRSSSWRGTTSGSSSRRWWSCRSMDASSSRRRRDGGSGGGLPCIRKRSLLEPCLAFELIIHLHEYVHTYNTYIHYLP